MSIVNGFIWVALGQSVKIFTQLVALFYLTHLIPPSEYGLLAMASVVMNLANVFNDLGTGSAVIQRENPSQEFYNYIYKINLTTGFLVMLVVIIMSPLIVFYFNHVDLYPILFLLALSFPISSISIVHKAKLEKQMAFKAVVKIEILASFAAMIVAIFLANLDFGLYSLVIQTLTSISIATLAFLKTSDLNLSIKKTIINQIDKKGIVNFSGYLLSFNLVNYFTRNLDSILIGRFFSITTLGAYSIAYRIMLFPLQSLTLVTSRVFLPHFSKGIESQNKNKDHYLKALKVILSLSAPMMLGLAATSTDFTEIFLDTKWFLVGDLLVWLAPTAIIQSALSTTGTVFVAYAKTKWLFSLGCIGALLSLVSFSVGVFFDIKTLVCFYFFANLINFFPVFFLLKKILGFKYIELIDLVVRSVLPAIFMFFSIKIMSSFCFFSDLELRFVISVFFGVICYLVFYASLNYKEIKKLITRIKSRMR